MDPLSILSLVEACAGLAVTAGKLAIGLKSLADNYRQAALTFRSLSSQCKLFATAVRAIQAWMEEAPEITAVDDQIWEQLADSLECANDAVYALENELVTTSGTSVNTFWNKANAVWNLQSMKDLEDCIHKQICSLSVILQIMNLPTRQSQTNSLQEKSSVFQESRSSAMSLRDADTSTLKGGGDTSSTIRAPSTIMTSLSQLPQFDFDEMLLTSQVYLRNRNKTLAMHAQSSGSGKTRDSDTLVSEWDLAPLPWYRSRTGALLPEPNQLDLRVLGEILEAGDPEKAKAYIETKFLIKYEELLAKYNKVKRYYFDAEAQVRELQKENKALKTNGTSGAATAQEQVRLIISLQNQLSEKKVSAAVTQELEKMKNKMDWYRIQLSYWESNSSLAFPSPTSESEARVAVTQDIGQDNAPAALLTSQLNTT